MAFEVPSMTETRELLAALFKFLFGDRNAQSRQSYHGKRITFVSGAVTQIHAHAESAKSDVMPDTAPDGTPINRWGNIYGVGRKGATSAFGKLALRVYGTVGSVQDAGSTLVHESGLTFTMPDEADVVSANGYVDMDVVAVDTGAATRLASGETLKFTSPAGGIKTIARLVKDMDIEGFDSEQYGQYRSRVLTTIGTPSAGGNAADFVKWALEVDGVTSAFVYANRAGIGTVDVVGLHSGSGTARHLSGGEQADLLAYLQTKAPAQLAGVGGSLRVLSTLADTTQIVEVRLTSNGLSQYLFDWNDSAGYTVASYNVGTRELQFSGGVLPATLTAGDRLIVKGNVSAQDGRQYVVEAISAVDKVILSKSLIVAPNVADEILSGGPLVDPVRNAIIAHLNGERVYLGRDGVPYGESSLLSVVGLAVLAEPLGPANPAGVYGPWIGGLIRNVLGKIAISKTGVRNFNVTQPAADYEAADPAPPLDGSVYLCEPLQIIVRSA